jgi:hypothetical protein
MHLDPGRILGATPLASRVLVVAHQLLFLLFERDAEDLGHFVHLEERGLPALDRQGGE